MQKRIVAYYVGQLFIILSFFTLAPLSLAFYDNDMRTMFAYGTTTLLSFLIGFGHRIAGKKLRIKQ
ncbi:MAG: hypothetical protein KDD33_12850, partial [Bdellovibrionales bacterium]|nr:hypothetical protein [Bdellovibrionales bacterium]